MITLKKGLTINQTKVLEYLKKNPEASLQEVAFNIELSLSDVKKICAKLQEVELLRRDGSKRDGRWITK